MDQSRKTEVNVSISLERPIVFTGADLVSSPVLIVYLISNPIIVFVLIRLGEFRHKEGCREES
jgi:hypothetical protein